MANIGFKYQRNTDERAGKSVWASEFIKAWNSKVEVIVLKKNPELNNYDTAAEAADLFDELLNNLPQNE